jgi:hypothetical protein
MNEALDEEVSGGLSAPAWRKVLGDVGAERAAQDDAEGYLRDYRDGTGGSAAGCPTLARDREAAREAARRAADATRSGAVTWRHLSEASHAGVVASPVASGELRAQLVRHAAVVLAWIEAIDRRADEARIDRAAAARAKPAGWWARLWRRLRRE